MSLDAYKFRRYDRPDALPYGLEPDWSANEGTVTCFTCCQQYDERDEAVEECRRLGHRLEEAG